MIGSGISDRAAAQQRIESLESKLALAVKALEKIYDLTKIMSDIYSRDIGDIASTALEVGNYPHTHDCENKWSAGFPCAHGGKEGKA